MIFVGLAIFIALLFLLQRQAASHGLKNLREDHLFSAPAAEPDSPVEVILRFANHSRLFLPFVRYRERVPEVMEARDGFIVQKDVHGASWLEGTLWLKPRQKAEKRIPVSFGTRGRYLLSDLTVACGDYLGTDEESRRSRQLREIVIYPKAWPGGSWEAVPGGNLGDMSVRRFIHEDPVLTLGFREYTGTEPMKQISWTKSAQGTGLMVRQYDYTTDPSVLVILNGEYAGPEREALLEICYSLARSCCQYLESRGIPYGFMMNLRMQGRSGEACYLPEGLGDRHFKQVLECLGRAREDLYCSCRMMLQRSLEGKGGLGGVFFITPGEDDASREARRMIQSRYGGHLRFLNAGEMQQP